MTIVSVGANIFSRLGMFARVGSAIVNALVAILARPPADSFLSVNLTRAFVVKVFVHATPTQRGRTVNAWIICTIVNAISTVLSLPPFRAFAIVVINANVRIETVGTSRTVLATTLPFIVRALINVLGAVPRVDVFAPTVFAHADVGVDIHQVGVAATLLALFYLCGGTARPSSFIDGALIRVRLAR